jgi:hypothetical protein
LYRSARDHLPFTSSPRSAHHPMTAKFKEGFVRP